MKRVLVCCLTYGRRPLDILLANLSRAGHPADIISVALEGVANSQNAAIDVFNEQRHDVLAFLSNDIVEQNGWLREKVLALENYEAAGVVASRLDAPPSGPPQSELLISNWAMSRRVIEAVGYFDDEMHPYGPIDLEYCQRVWAAGMKTYYVSGLKAEHASRHAAGDEYGWNKESLVNQYLQRYQERTVALRAGTLQPFNPKRTRSNSNHET